jgi:hypothetical protein
LKERGDTILEHGWVSCREKSGTNREFGGREQEERVRGEEYHCCD